MPPASGPATRATTAAHVERLVGERAARLGRAAAGHGRQEGHLVAVDERGVALGQLLVHRGAEPRRERRGSRRARARAARRDRGAARRRAGARRAPSAPVASRSDPNSFTVTCMAREANTRASVRPIRSGWPAPTPASSAGASSSRSTGCAPPCSRTAATSSCSTWPRTARCGSSSRARASTCPAQAATLRYALEPALRREVPEVLAIVPVRGRPRARAGSATPAQLTAARSMARVALRR